MQRNLAMKDSRSWCRARRFEGACLRTLRPSKAAWSLFTFAVCLLSCIATTPQAGEVALVPMRVHVSIPPGQDYTTVVQVDYTKAGLEDTRPLRFVVSDEDWEMTDVGDLKFHRTDPGPGSARPFVMYSPREQEIVPGDLAEIRLSVIVPEDTPPGEYRAAIVVQPRTPYRELLQDDKKFALTLRLATILYVEVPPVRGEIEMTDLQMTRGSEGWAVESKFQNPGDVHIRLTDEFQIFELTEEDPEEGVFVIAGESKESGVVLPGNLRTLKREVGQFALYPGRFRLVYLADPGRDLPVMEGETVFEISDPHPGMAVRD